MLLDSYYDWELMWKEAALDYFNVYLGLLCDIDLWVEIRT